MAGKDHFGEWFTGFVRPYLTSAAVSFASASS